MAALIWVALGLLGGYGLCAVTVLACLPHWIANADLGVDPFAGLLPFDDTEAQQLLEQGA